MRKLHYFLPLLVAVAFWFLLLGCSRQGNILVYRVDQNHVAVHKDWITYGLPLTDQVELLSLLRDGKTNDAIRRLEVLLDTTVYDALQRRQVLEKKDVVTLDKTLARVVQYRSKHPRPITTAEGVYWSASRQRDLDTSLRQIKQSE